MTHVALCLTPGIKLYKCSSKGVPFLVLMNDIQYSLSSFSKSNTLIAIVKDGVVGSQEDVTQDPQRASRLRNVQAHEATDAL